MACGASGENALVTAAMAAPDSDSGSVLSVTSVTAPGSRRQIPVRSLMEPGSLMYSPPTACQQDAQIWVRCGTSLICQLTLCLLIATIVVFNPLTAGAVHIRFLHFSLAHYISALKPVKD